MLCFFQPYLVYMSKYFCCYILSRYLKTLTWTAWSWWKKTTWEQLRSRAYPLASTGSLMWVLSQMQRLKDWRHFRFLYVWFLLFWCLPEYLWSGVRVQRSSSNGQILLREEQRFFGQGLEKRRRLFFSIFSGYLLSLPKGGWGCIQAEGAYHVPSWNLRRLWTNVVQILEKILHIREAMINWIF